MNDSIETELGPSRPIPKKSFWRDAANLGALAYISLVLAASTWYWQFQYEDWATAIGYEIGTALVPTLIVFVYYYFRKGRHSDTAPKVSVLASGILFANLISIAGQKPHFTSSDIPTIAKEAAGLIPISNPNDQDRTAFRDYFKEIITQNKVYASKIKTLHLEGLYTPESYLDPRKSNRIIAEIDKAIRVEDDQRAALDAINTHCIERIDSLDWPERQKAKFKEGFEEGYSKQVLSQTPAINAEKEWFTSLRDFYAFVLDNHRHFRRSGDTILVTDGNVLEGFNRRIRNTNQLRENYLRMMKEFGGKQKQNYSALGLSTHDLAWPNSAYVSSSAAQPQPED